MTAKQTRLAKGVLIVAILLFAGRAIRSFPWKGTYQALLGAQLDILFVGLCINLLSMIAKGTAWHLLLRPLAPHRWSSAQVATFIGTSANSLSVSVAGEAVKIHSIVKRDRVPLEASVVSDVWARIIEVVGLAIFLVFVPALFRLPPIWRSVQLVAGAMLVVFAALVSARKIRKLPAWLPQPLARAVASWAGIGSWRRVVWPLALGVGNWIIQWTTFHLVLRSLGAGPTLAASLTALLATNLGGLLHLTPGNVGIFQAAMVASLVPFGIPSERAMAASLVLQAVQMVPVVMIGCLMIVPWRSLVSMRSQASWPVQGTQRTPQSSHS
jgi:uncharacterized membrane protein YbhN (UPF0104 family)